jgi:hypothetical protein
MRQAAAAALLLLVFASVRPDPAAAWGFNGHKFITDRAIDLLPQELRPFFEKFRTTIVEHSIDPDTYRTMGWTDEPPRHFVDMDAYGPFPFRDLPHDYKVAVERRGADFVIKNGTLPWRADEIYNQLRDAFKQVPTAAYARDNVKLFSSVLAHYVGDSFQPFHAAVNYDGQMTNQQGIHARFESELFDRYRERLRLTPAPVVPIASPREFVFATLADSFQLVEPILAADRAAIEGRTAYDDVYFTRLFDKTGPIMEKRMAGAMTAVASMITAAWTEAGKPPLPLDTPSRPPRPIRRQ